MKKTPHEIKTLILFEDECKILKSAGLKLCIGILDARYGRGKVMRRAYRRKYHCLIKTVKQITAKEKNYEFPISIELTELEALCFADVCWEICFGLLLDKSASEKHNRESNQTSYRSFIEILRRLEPRESHSEMIEKLPRFHWAATDIAEIEKRITRLKNMGNTRPYFAQWLDSKGTMFCSLCASTSNYQDCDWKGTEGVTICSECFGVVAIEAFVDREASCA